MFSQTVEYALRAVAFLASQSPDARNTEQIAKATKVPAAYLSKVLQSLAKARIVRSQRGLHGGFSLVKTPEELTILEVVEFSAKHDVDSGNGFAGANSANRFSRVTRGDQKVSDFPLAFVPLGEAANDTPARRPQINERKQTSTKP